MYRKNALRLAERITPMTEVYLESNAGVFQGHFLTNTLEAYLEIRDSGE